MDTGEPLPLKIHGSSAGATLGVLASAKLYVIGGTIDGYHGVNTTQIYDPQTGNWTLGAQMPIARLGLAVVYALGGISSVGPQNNKGTIYAVNEQYLPVDFFKDRHRRLTFPPHPLM